MNDAREGASPDEDRGKGAVEQDSQNRGGNMSERGQIGHRDEDSLLKSADTDFPEPGENPEHSGELEAPEDPAE